LFLLEFQLDAEQRPTPAHPAALPATRVTKTRVLHVNKTDKNCRRIEKLTAGLIIYGRSSASSENLA